MPQLDRTCTVCRGTGSIKRKVRGGSEFYVSCPACMGTGRVGR